MAFFSASSITYGVILDVGSGSVGVGILKSDEKEKMPTIIFSHRVYMRPAIESYDEGDRMRRMREALFSACLILSKDGLQALHDVDTGAQIGRMLVTCSSPWSHTVSRSVEFTPEKEFKVTETLVAELIQNAESEIAEHIDAPGFIGSQGLAVVERATVNIEVNEYHVDNAIGLHGSTLSLFHITGLIPEEILKAVEEVQEKILMQTKLSAHTYMLVAYCVLRDLFPNARTLSIVDVTAEATEIGIVQDGILEETIHVPYGSNTLIREIAEKTKGSPDDVMSYLRALGERMVHDEAYESVLAHLENYKQAVGEMLKRIHGRRAIPTTMVVTALPQLQRLFGAEIPKLAQSITGDAYTLLELQKNVLNEIANNRNDDVFIAIASRFFHKLHGCGELR
jgi:hypothetical protein